MGKPREDEGGLTVALWKSAGSLPHRLSCTLSGRAAFAQLGSSAFGSSAYSTG
ncbi:MAG: hypothetical protein HY231_01245 [Acidobacteria bacterium]|nr:hypothetical protein [Acidobacteriota bacterium]